MQFEHAKSKKCLYCDNIVKDNPHFQSDCCGRGMCDECYDNLQGTEEQIQMDYFDCEEQDEEIIKKCGWEDASYICFECFGNWAYYAKKE